MNAWARSVEGEEDQPDVAHRDLVPGMEGPPPGDRGAVDPGSIGGPEVPDDEAVAAALDPSGGGTSAVSWSPDETRLAYTAGARASAGGQAQGFSLGQAELATIHADGTGRRVLVPASAGLGVESPAWSPTGAEIAFGAFRAGQAVSVGTPALEAVHPDGSRLRTIVGPQALEAAFQSARPGLCPGLGRSASYDISQVTWNPDGTQLAFTMSSGGENCVFSEVMIVAANGSA